MHWKSFGDFLHMGGYGLYVWGSYGVTLLVMSVEALMGRQRFWAARQAINNLEQGK
ncbi:MAG: heme exporter protein CcmD [Polaromonas sp.]|nr:heme exporter protein CcmD [Polaromonas sp.]